MYGRIFGFQRLALCPKWTPASIKSFTWTMATHCPPFPLWGVEVRKNRTERFRPPSWHKGGKGYRSSRGGEGQRISCKKGASAPLHLADGATVDADDLA